MARNVKQDGNALPIDSLVEGGEQQPGIDNPEPQVMDATSVIQSLVPEAPPADEVLPDAPRARRWQVTGGPDSVVYDSQRVRMQHGKVYDEGCVDLDLLRRQGVVLTEIEG